MQRKRINRIINRTLSLIIAAGIALTGPALHASAAKSGAAESPEELEENAIERKGETVQSNEIPGWPAGPEVSAEAAIIMEVSTGTVLYEKNIHEELYPASTTKLMTCLIAAEQGEMTDIVDFSYEAVHSVPSDGSTIGMDAGESLTLDQALYGIMVGSANEVANAVGEYIAGSVDDFVALMNERAKELGCENTHFCNTNGYHDDDHYTSAYDLALIGSAFFSNEMLSRIANTPRYHFEPTETQPDDFYLKNKHALINGEIPYDGICGGKTGYTSDARQTLVTCCEQSGMKLICVVLMEESPDQFNDTVTLFNYGFSNFSLVSVAERETGFTTSENSFFSTGSDIFGDSSPFLEIDDDGYIVLPNNTEFDDLDTEVTYDVDESQGQVARITYSLSGVTLGDAIVEATSLTQPDYEFEYVSPDELEQEVTHNGIAIEREGETIFLNVRVIVMLIVIVAVTLAIIIVLISLRKNYHYSSWR